MKERGGAYIAGVASVIKSQIKSLEHQLKRMNGPGFWLCVMPAGSCPYRFNSGHLTSAS